MELTEPVEDLKIVLPIEMLSKFKLPYANTNHSVQGLTIEKEFTRCVGHARCEQEILD